MKYSPLLFLAASTLIWGSEPKEPYESLISFVKSETTQRSVPVVNKQSNAKEDALAALNGQTAPNFQALAQLQEFGILNIFFPNDKFDEPSISQFLINSFSNIGNLTLIGDQSTTDHSSQKGSSVCCFSIATNKDVVVASLNVITQVEVPISHYKTACPIWKKTLNAPIVPNTSINSISINLSQQLIDAFNADWKKADSRRRPAIVLDERPIREPVAKL